MRSREGGGTGRGGGDLIRPAARVQVWLVLDVREGAVIVGDSGIPKGQRDRAKAEHQSSSIIYAPVLFQAYFDAIASVSQEGTRACCWHLAECGRPLTRTPCVSRAGGHAPQGRTAAS